MQFDAEAANLNNASRERYTGYEGQQDAEAAKVADFYQAQNDNAPADIMPTSQSNITVSEEARQRGSARASTDKQGKASAQLRSFGDLLGTIGRAQGRDAGTIGQIAGFKAGSNNVMPYELEAASQKGGGLRLLGDVLGGVGSIALGGGLSGEGILGFGAKGAPAANVVTRLGQVAPRIRVPGTVRLGG